MRSCKDRGDMEATCRHGRSEDKAEGMEASICLSLVCSRAHTTAIARPVLFTSGDLSTRYQQQQQVFGGRHRVWTHRQCSLHQKRADPQLTAGLQAWLIAA